jgi:hypothetical protein
MEARAFPPRFFFLPFSPRFVEPMRNVFHHDTVQQQLSVA